MAFQAGECGAGSSTDYIHAYRRVLLALSFTAVVSSHAPKPMRSQKTDAEQKFEEILQRFEIPLLQYAVRITGDRERARDVVQETFVKFQRNGAINRADEPSTWLFTVCRNAALNVCRKERRMMYLDEEAIELREAEEPLPFDRLEQKEAAGFLLRIVATLPVRQEEMIQLNFQSDLSYQQIATIMKTTANNVAVLLQTALKTLRQRYGEIAEDFIPFKQRTTE